MEHTNVRIENKITAAIVSMPFWQDMPHSKKASVSAFKQAVYFDHCQKISPFQNITMLIVAGMGMLLIILFSALLTADPTNLVLRVKPEPICIAIAEPQALAAAKILPTVPIDQLLNEFAYHEISMKSDQRPLEPEAMVAQATFAKPNLNEMVKEKESVPPYYTIILRAADRHNIDPALIRAVIMAESSYNPKAISKSGAKGLMQLMPRTAKALGVKDILDPIHNINGGTKYLRQLLNRFNGDIKLALAAYNAGSRHVKRYRGIPPFKETRTYVKKVLSYYKNYQKEAITTPKMMAIAAL